MSVTLQQIRDECYKLLDEYSTTTASIDSNITNRIDGQINRYYFELAQKDKVSATEYISQFPVANMLGETFSYNTYTTTAVTYTQASAYAYYFEVDNDCTVDVQEASSDGVYTTLSTITVTGASCFTSYKNFVTATVSSDNIKLSFYGDNVFTIKNVAMYPYTFGNVTANIPSFTPSVNYQISSDFMDIKNITFTNNAEYGKFTDFTIENGKLMIPRGYSTEFRFNYYKKVNPLTSATDTFEIQDENAWIIPYGVAGTVLIGNGFNVGAGQVLNGMYEQKKNQIDTSENFGRQEIYNIKGW